MQIQFWNSALIEQKHGFVFLVCVWKGRWGGGGGCKDGGDRDYSDRHDCSHLAFKRQLKPASNIWLSGFCPDLVDDQRMLSTLSRPRPWTSVKAVLITMACGITKTKKRLQLKKKLETFQQMLCKRVKVKWLRKELLEVSESSRKISLN